jgi:hypothetical protein
MVNKNWKCNVLINSLIQDLTRNPGSRRRDSARRRVRARRGGRTDMHGGKGAVGTWKKWEEIDVPRRRPDTSRCTAAHRPKHSCCCFWCRGSGGTAWLSVATVAALDWPAAGVSYPMELRRYGLLVDGCHGRVVGRGGPASRMETHACNTPASDVHCLSLCSSVAFRFLIISIWNLLLLQI